MMRAFRVLAAVALGVTAIAVLAAVQGERRRALRGEIARRARRETPSDELLVLRVRAALGHFTTHPKSIRVAAALGRITLRGRVLAAERADLLAAVRRVDGVEAVDDHLTTYLDAIGVPQLQGGDPPA